MDFHHTCEVFLHQVNAEWPMQQTFPHNTADQLASTWLKRWMLLRMKLHFMESPAIQKPRSYHTNGLFRHATFSPATCHSAFHRFIWIIAQIFIFGKTFTFQECACYDGSGNVIYPGQGRVPLVLTSFLAEYDPRRTDKLPGLPAIDCRWLR